MTTLKTRIAEVRALAEKAPQGKYTCGRGYLYLGDDPEQIVHSDFDVDENGFNFLAASPEMVAIINELTDKLDIARKAFETFISDMSYCGYEKHDGTSDMFKRARQALELTDIGE